ncbi:MAG: RHS repeat-associated core domain-containing protein, partial [Barnesiella intestinihominis]
YRTDTDTDTIVNGYRFTYDAHDRLASAYSVTGSDFSSGRYHVEYGYDKHGNMVNLYRNGGTGGMIDEMNWFYEGNRVVEITDMMEEQGRYDMKEYRDYNHNGLDYFYDSNGNMTADLDRDIVAIRYNLLNLPDTVQFRNGSAIVNYYTADGKRTGSKYLTPQTTVVIPAGQTFGSTSGTAAMSSHVTARRGSLEYAGADFESDTLIRIHNGDGYLDCSEQDFRYFVRDYQGNIRTVYGSAVAKLIPVEPPFSLTNRGAIGGDKPPIRPKPIEHTVTYQRMQYYPFGLPYEAHYQPEEQPYKYGGKEFIELHGYDSYDFDARMYYPALCRFMTMDPLCEKYYSISPYAYCNNNPVKYVDPDGRDIWEINDVGKIVNRIKDKTQDAFYMVDNKGNRTYTTDVDGNKSYNSISFEYGTITDFQKAGGLFFKKDATNFSVADEASGASLFKFFADNTKIEFGLINTQSNGSTVMTNHKEGSVKASLTAQQLSDKGQTVTSIIHNHPNSTQPSGFRAGDTSGDKFAANILPNVDRYVYQPKNNALVMYDNKSIIGTMSWNMVFSPATIVAPRLRTPHIFYPGVGLPPH